VGENNAENRPADCSEPQTGQDQLWFVGSGCSRHMTSEKANFLSPAATQGGSVAFGNGKLGTIVSIGKIGESLSNSIKGVYLVDGLKHNLVSVSQLCDKDNLVVFTLNRCLVANMDTRDIVLRGKRHKNVYNMCTSSLPQNTLTCLSILNDDAFLWHKRLGLASLSSLNKLVSKDLVVVYLPSSTMMERYVMLVPKKNQLKILLNQKDV